MLGINDATVNGPYGLYTRNASYSVLNVQAIKRRGFFYFFFFEILYSWKQYIFLKIYDARRGRVRTPPIYFFVFVQQCLAPRGIGCRVKEPAALFTGWPESWEDGSTLLHWQWAVRVHITIVVLERCFFLILFFSILYNNILFYTSTLIRDASPYVHIHTHTHTNIGMYIYIFYTYVCTRSLTSWDVQPLSSGTRGG